MTAVFNRIKDIYKVYVRGDANVSNLIKRGMVVGENLQLQGECKIDSSHAWLISIGDNVTIAPRVHILAHDASTKKHLGYTRIGLVSIGDNVFVGADSVILPGVQLGGLHHRCRICCKPGYSCRKSCCRRSRSRDLRCR